MTFKLPARKMFVALMFLLLGVSESLAQSPFGVGQAEPSLQPQNFGVLSGVITWIATTQAALYAEFSTLMSQVKTSPTAAATLILFCFLYGFLHAAGPGHGKVIISTYLLATRETWKRGIFLSFISALLQGITAIVFVCAALFIFSLTATNMTRAAEWLEVCSFALIALMGAGLLLRFWNRRAHDKHCTHEGCNHVPNIDVKNLTKMNAKSAALAALSVGFRPCSGAILVLVFAAGQGVLQVGALGVLAMSIGTGLAVAILASLTLYMKHLTLKLSSKSQKWGESMGNLIEFVAALTILFMGLTFFAGSLQRLILH